VLREVGAGGEGGAGEEEEEERGGGEGAERGGWLKLDETKICAKGKAREGRREDRQYNYEQARSTKHASRPADFVFGNVLHRGI